MKSNKKKSPFSRRQFVKSMSVAAMAAPFTMNFSGLSAKGVSAPSDKINLGIIGCGGLGKANLNACVAHPDVVVTAACDVWKERLDPIVERFKKTCTGYTDYRELLRHKGLDAVIIATPAHWHAIQAIEAAEAGLDIYLQKPMTMHLGESLAVRNAIRKHKNICQVGTQIHSGDHYRRMVELVRSGNLGDIGTVRTFFVMNEAPNGIGLGNNTKNIPKGMDWDMWVGPAEMKPFNPNLVKDAFYHCFWMDYSGGWTPGMAPHITDLPIWALQLDYPTEISASGGRFIIKDDGDAYDNHEVIWRYPNLTMTWMQSSSNSYGFDFLRGQESKRRLGIYFHGSNGTLLTDYDTHQVLPEGDRMKGMQTPAPSIASSPGHELEWLDCIKTRKQPSCNPEYHIKVDAPIALSVLSMKLGRSIKFDPATEKIVGDAEAARLAIPEYRAPWKFPAKYL
ncbi:Gfo/Idh/MocA family oxidoreductase [Agriterribacter sp.]|uniref:Gfo/Idh/MocA family protein n=1 Tax=Agriterribacter sp. TaxID=2821509 RepID=UPI002C5EECEF|nr:Gfo/Idh/MocA family oxidoreductase [Agriterribacter sp.]HRO47948.1 Gfo/Idh/MocA family oxidoreductase [Agriterribacter sp.]HRQ18629.1 Gfo/Idh/MocA family oxidoreductase [Agriterribacter sp.]